MRKQSIITWKIILISTICLLSILAIACAQQAPAATTSPVSVTPTATCPKTGGILKLSLSQEAGNLGWPASQSTLQDYISSRTAVEYLMRTDAKGDSQPWLAESWTTDANAKTITIKLKKGIKFQDGTDFNAEAVKWNLDKFGAVRSEIPKGTVIDILDDYTVKATLKEWDSTAINGIGWYGAMISPAAWKNAPGATTDKERETWCLNNPIGTGPFQLVSWQKTLKQTYKKNPNYWQKGKPYLDGLEWHTISDSQVASAAFQAKEIDGLWYTDATVARDLKKAGYTITELTTGQGLLFKGIMGNSANPDSPFAKLQMRQALSYAIDKQAIINSIYGGFAFPMNQYAVDGSSWASPNFKGFPYNPEKAKQLVIDAGYPNGVSGKLFTLNDPVSIALATAYQGMLAKVGINVQLDPVLAQKRLQVISQSQFEFIDSSSLRMDPEPTTQFIRVVSANGFNYYKSLTHPDEIEKLILAARQAPDDASKKQIVHQLQEATFEKYNIFTPTLCPSGIAIKQPYVKGDKLMEIKLDEWTPEDAWLDK